MPAMSVGTLIALARPALKAAPVMVRSAIQVFVGATVASLSAGTSGRDEGEPAEVALTDG